MGNTQTSGKRGEGIGKQKTALFRQQHSELLETVGRLAPLLLSVKTVTTGAADIRQLLMRLGGQLSVHLSMEDKGLYPQLKEHGSVDVAKLTRQYETEMGGLKAEFTKFSEGWLRGNAIGERPKNSWKRPTRSLLRWAIASSVKTTSSTHSSTS